MFNNLHNIRVIAKNNGSAPGFTIYLDFSGGSIEPLIVHRHNGLLYNSLKDGVRIEELQRMAQRNKRSKREQKLHANISHVLKAAEEYILYEREASALQKRISMRLNWKDVHDIR